MPPQVCNESEAFLAVFTRVSSFGAAAPLVLECSTPPLCFAHAHHKAPANAACSNSASIQDSSTWGTEVVSWVYSKFSTLTKPQWFNYGKQTLSILSSVWKCQSSESLTLIMLEWSIFLKWMLESLTWVLLNEFNKYWLEIRIELPTVFEMAVNTFLVFHTMCLSRAVLLVQTEGYWRSSMYWIQDSILYVKTNKSTYIYISFYAYFFHNNQC